VDTIARILQPRWQEALGQPIVIDNKGGASGSIGAAEAARAAPDGYTWLLAYDTTATNESVMRLPYKTLEAFAPVSLVATGPLCMVAHKDTPYQTFRDVVEAAKREPGDINYATSGVGGLAHVATTLLQQQGGFKLAHVPYRGAGPAVQDAMAGHVPLFMSNVVVISQHIKSGVLRPLGVTTPGETPHVPGVPSFAQQGFSGFEAPTWWALLGRAGTPEPILRKMSEAVVRVMAMPEVRDRIEASGADVAGGGPERCRRFLNHEVEKWGQVIRDNNITAES
jgi:tripartite-type tricarboxylate transporter receptor subunit TctC